MTDSVTLEQLVAGDSFNLVTLCDNDDDDDKLVSDSPFHFCKQTFEYYEPAQFNRTYEEQHGSSSYFHLNCRGISSNWTFNL